MASSTSLVFNLIGQDHTNAALRSARRNIQNFSKSATSIIAGMAIAEPALAAIGAAAAGLAAGAAAAGMAVGAFSAAATPQLGQVTEAWTLYEKAQKAAVEGGEQAKAAQDELNRALAAMSPATRETATAFFALKTDYKSWSDSLSSTTMPVFTKAFRILRDLLPTMTPFVRAAASAFSDLMDRIAKGIRSAGFKEWIGDFQKASGPALRDFIAIIGNLGKGFGGLLQAFLPSSRGITGGLRNMSKAFADWGTGLKGSPEFERFMAYVSENGPKLWGILKDLGQAVGNILMSLAPFTGATLVIAQAFAQIIGNTPVPVLTALAGILVGLRIATLLWAAAQTVVTIHNAIWTASQWSLNAAMFANPMTWVIIGIVALIAAIVLIATKTTWFQTAWKAMTSAVVTAWNWVWQKVKAIAGFLVNLFMNWTIVGRVIKHWDAIKSRTVAVWNAVVAWVRKIPGRLVSLFMNWTIVGQFIKHWDRIKSGTIRVATSLVSWVRGLPGRISRAVGGMGSLLYSKGRSVMQGLWNGISSMGGWLWSRVKSFVRRNVVDAAKSFLNIGSPSKLMADQIGHWIPAGIAQGAEDNAGVLDRTMTHLVKPQSAMPSGPLVSPTGPMMGGAVVTIRFLTDDAELKKKIRKMVKVDGRGSVVTAFE